MMIESMGEQKRGRCESARANLSKEDKAIVAEVIEVRAIGSTSVMLNPGITTLPTQPKLLVPPLHLAVPNADTPAISKNLSFGIITVLPRNITHTPNSTGHNTSFVPPYNRHSQSSWYHRHNLVPTSSQHLLAPQPNSTGLTQCCHPNHTQLSAPVHFNGNQHLPTSGTFYPWHLSPTYYNATTALCTIRSSWYHPTIIQAHISKLLAPPQLPAPSPTWYSYYALWRSQSSRPYPYRHHSTQQQI
ncbi:hypothetical protein F0Q53_01495 [Anaplasma marginale]|uniref:OMP2 n=1 Tax=Anaplasma marginale TaxID=770 RepID=A0A643CNE1_ANAMA|nr:hypothetical protein F0Q53_01495 [Anaplasma marginale]KAB0452478.1 hypothetical protein FY207_00780 [Anaplasma marginale]